jgi:FERM, RhoGEF and pleckstrin domain protein 2
LPDDCEEYGGYKIDGSFPTTSSKFETLDLSENVDEMGFPRYDRLRQIVNMPPQKPARQKKKTQVRGYNPSVHCYGQDSGSGTETKAGLSDDVYGSSEDSFAAAFNKHKHNVHSYKNIELPYPDFLSDYDENEGAKAAYGKQQNDSEKSFDSEEDEELSENKKF